MNNSSALAWIALLVSCCIKRWVELAIFIICLAFSTPGIPGGFTLSDALAAALVNDPVLLAADARRRADLETLPQGRAALLPQVSFQSTRSSNTTTTREKLGIGGSTLSSAYQSSAHSLVLNQALFNSKSWRSFQKTKIDIQIAQASYEAEIQQATNRLVSAYLEVLRLNAEYVASELATRAKAKRLESINRMFNVGQLSSVDQQSAEAEYAIEEVNRRDFEAQLFDAKRAFTRLTGYALELSIPQENLLLRQCVSNLLAVVRRELSLRAALSLEQHPLVLVNRLRFEAANLEAKIRSGGHLPTVDFFINLNAGVSASELTIGRDIRNQIVGVRIDIPVFSGGRVSASVREALFLQEKAEIDLKDARSNLESERQSAKNQVQVAAARIEADYSSLDAAEKALELESRKYLGQMSSMVEELQARAAVSAATARLYGSISKMVSGYVRFRLSIGNLSQDALRPVSRALNSCFTSDG